ncbi:MAG: hypothetical protein ACOCRO_03895 [Halanaerobiales bacterium]
MKLLKCKRCHTSLIADDTYIIHVGERMLVLQSVCPKCKRKNIIETERWKIK